MKNDGFAVISVRAESNLREALQAFADENHMSISAAARTLLKTALKGKKNFDGDAYNDGLRKALHDAHVAMRDALTPLWQES